MKTITILWVGLSIMLSPILRAEDHKSPGAATGIGANATTNNAVAAEESWHYAISEILMSKYYGTIFGGTFYPGPMSFGDVSASHKSLSGSVTFDLAIGQKLDRIDQFNRDGGNEYDLTIDQTLRFGSKAYPILVDLSLCYLALKDLKDASNDAFDESVRFDFPIRADLPSGPIIQPYFQVYHYHMVGDGLRNEGWIGYCGLIRDQHLGAKLFGSDLILNLDYRMGVNGGVYGSRSGIEYHRLAVSLPIHWKKWTFVPSIIGQTPGGSERTYVHKSEVFGTLFIRRDF